MSRLKPDIKSGIKPDTRKAVYVAFGSNLSTPAFPDPAATVSAAISSLGGHDRVHHRQTAYFYESEPVPKSDQPRYINTVALYETGLEAEEFMRWCHDIENRMGRQRSVPNAARVIDIDLIDFKGRVENTGRDKSECLVLPHPGLRDRAFVLQPLNDLNPAWTDPRDGTGPAGLLAGLPAGQALGTGIRRLGVLPAKPRPAKPRPAKF